MSGILPAFHWELVLLHISSKVPEAFWDLEKDPVWQQKVQTVRGWERQQERKISDFMDRARQVLVDAGFPGETVRVEIRERREGIARDIGKEGLRGYGAVILGRRGLSTVQDLSLGGVAQKLALKLTGTTVWLVGGKPEQTGILIGLDSSEGSMAAVEYVAEMNRGSDPRSRSFMSSVPCRAVRGTSRKFHGGSTARSTSRKATNRIDGLSQSDEKAGCRGDSRRPDFRPGSFERFQPRGNALQEAGR